MFQMSLNAIVFTREIGRQLQNINEAKRRVKANERQLNAACTLDEDVSS
jgi:hypothetical protein